MEGGWREGSCGLRRPVRKVLRVRKVLCGLRELEPRVHPGEAACRPRSSSSDASFICTFSCSVFGVWRSRSSHPAPGNS